MRAELAIQRALAELNRKNAGAGKPELVARIGLETGPVVVDATGEVYGDVPNTAARVQALADFDYSAGATPGRRPLRRRRTWLPSTERSARAGDIVPAHPGKRRRTPLRRASAYAPRRSRGGNGDADAALGAGAAGRRAISADRRRAGPPQVSGMPDDAIEWWGKAGDQALRRSARAGRAPGLASAFLPSSPLSSWRGWRGCGCSGLSPVARAPRRFPPPWSVEEPGRRSAAHLLTRDEGLSRSVFAGFRRHDPRV